MERSFSLFDSHAHLTSEEMVEEAEEAIALALDAGVREIVNVCTDRISLEAGLVLAEKYPDVLYTAAATHPNDARVGEDPDEGDPLFSWVARLAEEGRLAAIGETGLDDDRDTSPREGQVHFLRRYLRLARRVRLPLIIHCRDAFADLIPLLDEEGGIGTIDAPVGVLHCFTGTQVEAERLLARGWLFSFSGILTYKKREPLCSVAMQLPKEAVLLETDAPFLAPGRHRGRPNTPAYLVETATRLAELWGTSLEEVGRVTTDNGRRLFRRKSR